MIGYDSTNAVAQGLAAREKIFSFAYSYFMFFYKLLPSLSLKYTFSGEVDDLLTTLAKKLDEYFHSYVEETEKEKNKAAIAKYYLAAIYYYEPTYNFKDSSIQDIYRLGQSYLLELFKENINYFTENAKKYSFYAAPNFPNVPPEDLWKFFVYAMLKAQSAGQLSSIIQQPVSTASRAGNEFISFVTNYLFNKDYDFGIVYTNNKSTHKNKLAPKVNLSDVKTVGWTLYYDSVLEYVKNSWRYVYKNLIDFDNDEYAKEWFNSYGGNNFDNSLTSFLQSIEPNNPLPPAEQNNRFSILINYVISAANGAGSEGAFFKIKAGNSLPDKNPKPNLILPSGNSLDITGFFEDNTLHIIPLMNYYENLLTGYKNLVDSETSKKQYLWEDAPNVIKCYIDQEQNYIDTNLDIQQYLQYDENMFISYYLNSKNLVSYPGGDVENNLDINVFFEFSFQPNYERIIKKFGENFLDKTNFDYLKDRFLLNFSKTETYEFLKEILGESKLSQLTIQEFSSLFDLNVALLHKVTKKHISGLNYQDPLLSCDTTQFSCRRWNSGQYYRQLFFYNPLIDYSKNIVPKKGLAKKDIIEGFECNHSITIGTASDFGIVDIRQFNPVEIFKNDANIYLFVERIKNTSLEIFIKQNYNINPYTYPIVAEQLLEVQAASMPQSFIENNQPLFTKTYSDFSKNLLDNLITNIDKIK
jgi:hypothetical protein